ncbi:hypothetical protein ACLKM7_13965 [Microbacterium sp. I2]|uniref:hypothetical protein n=1 Tax=Microbacterium sp. I2 TaxID=3391826 RepID=UPI003ED8B9DA
MRKVGTFHMLVAIVVVLGLGSTIAAVLGATALAISLVGFGLAVTAVLLWSMDRRARAAASQIRRSVDQATRQSTNRIVGEVQRVETLVDAMQRRVVASVESARVEAADRHRASATAK